VTVPLVEELCWRGFVMRALADPDRPFPETPFGTHRWKSYFVVTALVTVAHRPEDWIGAWIFGSLVYAVAVRTRSMAACVLAHAVANGFLGIVVVATRQWGYW
jgi:CAAX prenyl protease-like protein